MYQHLFIEVKKLSLLFKSLEYKFGLYQDLCQSSSAVNSYLVAWAEESNPECFTFCALLATENNKQTVLA